jgi:hypothetical protein
MKRIILRLFLFVTIVCLAWSGSAQTTGSQGQTGQGHMQQQPKHKAQDSQSMQDMMQQLDGMMAHMAVMMQQAHHDVTGSQAMPGMNAPNAASGNWPSMMQTMKSLGESMHQMMTYMHDAMSDHSLMANPTFQSNMAVMQKHIQNMMGSLQGMIHNMEQIQKTQQGAKN